MRVVEESKEERGVRRRVQSKAAAALALLLATEVGARIVAPSINGEVLREYNRQTGGGGLLGLYDFLVGGALSRGAVLALGIMPYISARLYLRLARVVFPRVERLTTTEAGRARLKKLTRWLTGGFALVQSLGFALFVQKIPGVVAHPGLGFVVQTVAVLTSGALFCMYVAEKLKAPERSEGPPSGTEESELRFTTRRSFDFAR
jgi:preprotein translocase subunit SecY